MSTILLTEDDYYLRRDLTELLSKEGFSVSAARSLSESVQMLRSGQEIDLFLVDLWLPDGDGYTLLSEIRARSDAPVLFLTVRDDERSAICALEQGADDYITKPFRKAELLSRIRANLRRQTLAKEEYVLESGGLSVNVPAHEVCLNGEILTLRPTEYRLLLLFMENPGRLLTRDRLLTVLEETYIDDAADDNSLNVQISRLRKALPAGLIKTERGFGYRFQGEVHKRGSRKV